MKKIILTSLILCLAWFAGAQTGSVTVNSVAQTYRWQRFGGYLL
jgi:hypothetical protein